VSASAPQPERVETGEWIGRYRLCFEIATGGMATVYLARSEGPGGFEKLVALKRVRQAYSEEQEFVDMFLDEARIASKISHANVCQVFDFGEADGAHYITMEYLSGAPLSRVRARLTESLTPQQDRLAPWAIAAVLAGVAEGLHAAHELRGEDQEPLHVVHRDVSPQNIFLTYDGVGKVLDFGVASARNRLHKTTSGTVKGKHGYMAPEQLTALPIDRRTDVWALGVVLWEMLARRPLFRGRNESETLYAVVNGTVPPPSEVRDGVPPALEEVAMAALQREPEDRYASAREMGRALRRALASHGEPVGPAEIAEWMQELFAVDRERELEMIETARRHAEPRPLRERTGAITVTRSTGGVAAPPPPTGGSRAPLLPLALLVVALLAVAAWWLTRPSTTPTDARAEAPSAAPSSPSPPAIPEIETPEVAEPQVPAPEPTLAAPETEPAPQPEVAPPAERPTRRPPPRPAPPPEDGTVNLAARGGWAEVYEGGRLLGQTPFRVTLPAGTHRLRLLPFGEEPAIALELEVRAGEVTRRVVQIDPPVSDVRPSE